MGVQISTYKIDAIGAELALIDDPVGQETIVIATVSQGTVAGLLRGVLSRVGTVVTEEQLGPTSKGFASAIIAALNQSAAASTESSPGPESAKTTAEIKPAPEQLQPVSKSPVDDISMPTLHGAPTKAPDLGQVNHLGEKSPQVAAAGVEAAAIVSQQPTLMSANPVVQQQPTLMGLNTAVQQPLVPQQLGAQQLAGAALAAAPLQNGVQNAVQTTGQVASANTLAGAALGVKSLSQGEQTTGNATDPRQLPPQAAGLLQEHFNVVNQAAEAANVCGVSVTTVSSLDIVAADKLASVTKACGKIDKTDPEVLRRQLLKNFPETVSVVINQLDASGVRTLYKNTIIQQSK